MEKKIQGIPDSYNDVIDEITAYIKDRIKYWNNYIASDETEFIELIEVQLHGSRLRGQAKENSDLDCVFEYSGNVREDDLFNFMNDDEDGTYTIYDIPVDFNPINANKTGTMEDYMVKSDLYDKECLATVKEAIDVLIDNNYIVEGIVSKALATGALAAGLAFGNSGIQSKQYGPNSVPNDKYGFGKTSVHVHDRYDYPSTKYGVPTSFKLPDGKKAFNISHKDEIELTKAKILATPDSMLKAYGKEHIDEIANLMARTANKYNVDIDILLAIAGTESNFSASAKSEKDAQGMMQITKTAAFDSHTRLQGKDSTTFRMCDYSKLPANIDNAGRIVADLSKRLNNVVEMIFAGYNGGFAQASAWRGEQLNNRKYAGGKPVPKLTTETRNYVQRCIGLYKIYKGVQNDYIKQSHNKNHK